MNQPPIMTVTNLKKSFKTTQVLKGVNFSVQKGEVFALLGSNGAGKTTTIKILSTLMQQYEGTVQIGGVDLAKNPRKVRELISLTGQFAALDLTLSARANMRTICELRGIKNYDSKIDELLTRFSLTDVQDKKVETYSGGMKRRLDIAMSLLGEPQIIFLDEPTTGIDPQNRIAMWEIIKTLAGQGVTIFLTTQYLEEAEALADTVAILDKGIITDIDTVQGLKEKHGQDTLENVFLSIVNNDNGGQLNA